MKILIFSVISSYKYGNTGIDYIAKYLRKNENDTITTKYYHHNEMAEFIKDDMPKDYDIYAFSVFETNYKLFKELAGFIKYNNENAIVIFGGQFVTINYLYMLEELKVVDYFILGDGERPFERIINHHRYIHNKLEGDINIATANDYLGKQSNVERDVNRETSFDYFEYDAEENNKEKTHCMLTKSNICAGACSFCCSKKGIATYKNSSRIVDEISYLANSYGVKKFFLCDDDIFDVDCDENRERLHTLFDRIENLQLNLAFSGFAKAKSICNHKNRKLLEKMSRIGFHHLFIGIDAGNEIDRKLYNKKSTLDEGKEAIKILNSIGISPRYGMIFINPYTTLETMRENFRFLIEIHSTNYYHYGGLKVQLLSGTQLFERVKRDDLLNEKYSFLNTQEYLFKNPEIYPIVEFVQKEVIPKADSVKNQFNTLKRKYDLVRHINKEAENYKYIIEEYEEKEFQNIKNFFFCLYEQNNLEYCRNNLGYFIQFMEKNSIVYKPIIEELDNIFLSTPAKK